MYERFHSLNLILLHTVLRKKGKAVFFYAPNRTQPGSLRELSALFLIISKNSSMRSGLTSAWTTTAKGLAADILVVEVDEKALLVPPRRRKALE